MHFYALDHSSMQKIELLLGGYAGMIRQLLRWRLQALRWRPLIKLGFKTENGKIITWVKHINWKLLSLQIQLSHCYAA